MKTAAELLERLDYQLVTGKIDGEVTDLVYDSRKVTEGCMFVCIRGAAYDSHEH
jgi:UDP-N-acetylmuramoyl-L-alanyl-D-glutamate--2,6-diaminopimelate ligase